MDKVTNDNSKVSNDTNNLLKIIMEQKKELDRLRKENNNLKNRVLLGNKMVYFLDILKKGFLLIKENKIVDCNDTIVKTFGYYNKSDIIGKMPFELPIQNDFIEKLYSNNRLYNKNNCEKLAFKCKFNNPQNGEGLIHVDIVSYNNLNEFTAYVFITEIKDQYEAGYNSNIGLHNQYSFIQGHMSTLQPKAVEVLVEADTGVIIYASPCTYKCIGSDESLIGKKIYNCLISKKMPIYSVIFSNYDSCKNKSFPVTKSTKDCEIEYGVITSSAYSIGGKDYIAIRTVDRTRNINQVNRLRRSEKKYIDIFNSVNDSIFIHHFNDECKSKFIDVNDVACKRLGYTKEELLNMTIKDIKTEKGRLNINERMDELKKKNQLFFESEHISRLGDIIPVEINSKKVNLFGEELIISVARDISRRKWIENFLTQSEERNRRLVEILPNPIILIKEGCIVYANSTAKEFMAASENEHLLGRNLNSIFTAVDERSEKIFSDVLINNLDKQYHNTEVRLIRNKDNEHVDVELTTSLFRYSNKEVMVLHFRDLKHIKKSQKYERLFSDAVKYDKLKTLFFANLSHEFKTPLNVMFSALQVLMSSIDKSHENYAGMVKMGNKLKLNGYRLLRLVNNLIDLTKIDSGFYDMNLVNCNIVQLIENICDYSLDIVKERGIRLVFDTDKEEINIACDTNKIDRIILNLLSNAIKFTERDGTIIVSISSYDDYIEISVKDDGIGIPEEMVALIFKHFNQMDKSFTRKNEGCGIGLTLVKYLIQMHKGSIRVKSEDGVGSEFIIRLPIVLIDEVEDNKVDKRGIIYRDTIDIEYSDIYKV